MSQQKSSKDSPVLPQGWSHLEDREWAGRMEMVIAIVSVNKINLTDRSLTGQCLFFSCNMSRCSFCKQGYRLLFYICFPSVFMHVALCCKRVNKIQILGSSRSRKGKDSVSYFCPFHPEIQSFTRHFQHTFLCLIGQSCADSSHKKA